MSAKQKPVSFQKMLGSLSHRHNTHHVFDAFTRLAACALAAGTRENEYKDEAARWEKGDLEIFGQAMGSLVMEMESKPFEDVIGGCYMELALSQKGQQWNGEFHTPKPLCDLLANMLFGDIHSLPPEGPISICEPACGAGAMILAIGQMCPPQMRRRLRVTAIDINPTACDMTFINTTLWGIPTRVVHGNALTQEYWAAWSNLHLMAPLVPPVINLQSPDAKAQGQPPAAVEIQRINAALDQQEFMF